MKYKGCGNCRKRKVCSDPYIRHCSGWEEGDSMIRLVGKNRGYVLSRATFLIALLLGIGGVMMTHLVIIDREEKVRFLHYPLLRVPMENYTRMEEILNIQRRGNFLIIRNILNEIGTCLHYYNSMPEYNKNKILQSLEYMGRIIHSKDEPNGERRAEWENGIINKITIFGMEIKRYGVSRNALQYFKDLYEVYRGLYHNERLRQNRKTREGI